MSTEELIIENAVIESTEIDMGDRGLLTAWIELAYSSGGQGFGGYALYLPKGWAHHELKSFAGHFIFRALEVAGVEKWSQLKGKTVRVRHTCVHVEAIGHIIKDDWFCPESDFAISQKDKFSDSTEKTK